MAQHRTKVYGARACGRNLGFDDAREWAMTLTRREVLRNGLLLPAGAALAGCVGDDAAFGFGDAPKVEATQPASIPPPSALLHLLKRTRFGISAADFDSATSLGAAGYLDRQLMPQMLPDDVEVEAGRRWPLLGLPPAALY